MSENNLNDLNRTWEKLNEIIKSVYSHSPSSFTLNLHEYLNTYYSSQTQIDETLAKLSDLYVRLSERFESPEFKQSTETVYDAYRSYLAESIKPAISYMTEEQRETVEEILPEISEAPDQTAQKTHRALTKSDWISLLGILLSLISLLVSQLPDSQLEQIAAQNTEIIEQNERLLTQEDEKIALLYQLAETANNVNDLIGELSEEPDPAVEITNDLSELVDDSAELDEDSDDFSDLDDETEDRGRLDQIDNTQEDDSSF